MNLSNVWTPAGKLKGSFNSLVGKGEEIWNPDTGLISIVSDGIRGVDNQKSSVREGDNNVIFGNDIDWRNGRRFSDNVLPHSEFLGTVNKNRQRILALEDRSSMTKQTLNAYNKNISPKEQEALNFLADSANQQQYQHSVEDGSTLFSGINYNGEDVMTANRGKDRFNDGKSIVSSGERLAGSAIPFAAAASQLAYWNNQPLTYHSTYASNPYESRALSEMSKLRANPYNAISAATQKEREAAYSNAQAGGLTGAQRNANRVAMAIGNMRNAADIYTQANAQNNAYRSQYAQMMMNAGQADRQARMQANQFDWDNYQKAHGAKVRGIETGLANLVGASNSAFADLFKVRMADKTLALYNQQLTDEQKKIANDAAYQKEMLNIQRGQNKPTMQPMLFGDWWRNPNLFKDLTSITPKQLTWRDFRN